MRLFIGIGLAPNVIERLTGTLDELRSAGRINWTPVGNLHITSKFIGEWPEERLHELTAALGSVAAEGPILVAISRFGFFPNPHRPHSFFAGVQAGPRLAELAGEMDEALLPIGCARESRPYQPHVTLGRIKPTHDIRSLREHIAGMTTFDFGAFEAGSFHLYLSAPGDRGSVYTKLATYDLIGRNA